LTKKLPLKDDNFVSMCADGVLFCKLIVKCIPNALDERTINNNANDKKSITENWNLAFQTAKGVGIRVAKVTQNDLQAGNEQQLYTFAWQTMKAGLIFHVKRNKEQLNLIKEGKFRFFF